VAEGQLATAERSLGETKAEIEKTYQKLQTLNASLEASADAEELAALVHERSGLEVALDRLRAREKQAEFTAKTARERRQTVLNHAIGRRGRIEDLTALLAGVTPVRLADVAEKLAVLRAGTLDFPLRFRAALDEQAMALQVMKNAETNLVRARAELFRLTGE
jgi:hypothetical protein